eukprot:gene8139-8979_t
MNGEKEIFYALVIGLPCEASSEDIKALFDPMSNEIQDLLVMQESQDHHYVVNFNNSDMIKSVAPGTGTTTASTITTLRQTKIFALASFASDASRKLFTALYHNIPMSIYKDCPPCLVIYPNQVNLMTTGEYSLQSTLSTMYPSFSFVSTGEKESYNKTPYHHNKHAYYYQLPTCALCLRRFRLATSLEQHISSEQILVGRSFYSNPSIESIRPEEPVAESLHPVKATRCIVCSVYYHVASRSDHLKDPSATTPSQHFFEHSMVASQPGKANSYPLLGSCIACGLLENIWVCLVCGYTGCGRYTSQHAHSHFLSDQHAFALELVSGRIWDYAADTFVHYENSSSIYGGVLQSLPHYTNLRFEDFGSFSLNHPSMSQETRPEDSFPPKKILISQREVQDRERALNESLGSQTVEKLTSITEDYERLMEQQLQEQQLYYEKLLARETVRAMELSYYYSRHAANPDLGGSESKFDPLSEIEDPHSLDVELEQDLREIEDHKIEISRFENEYRSLLDKWKLLDEENKQIKAENNVLLRKQKQMMTTEDDLRTKCEGTLANFQEMVDEMEQQIRDVTFCVATRETVENSSLREELSTGVILTGTAVPPSNGPGQGRGGRSSRGSSGSRKRK